MTVDLTMRRTRSLGGRRRAGAARWAGHLALPVLLAAPVVAHADPISLIVEGITVAGNLASGVATLASLFGDKAGDDHPLYSTSATPTISVTGTEFNFHLLLQQSNAITESVDDSPAQLTGTRQISTDKGPADAWKYSITITADIGSLTGNTTLNADGFVQHIRAPHPEQGEKPEAPAMAFNLGIARSCTGFFCTWTSTELSDSGTAHTVHPDGVHEDTLDLARLTARCCSTFNGDITFFQIELDANHPMPEPTALALVAPGLVGLWAAGRRKTVREIRT